MNNEQRRQKIASYGNAHTQLVEALRQFPLAMWHFKPAPDRWSIHEIIIHITDSEANSYTRCRRCIAEPGQGVMAYDENGWATALHYHDQDTEEAIELFRWLRRLTYNLIQTLPESVWLHTIEHPENGTMTLDDWLDTYERHVSDHIQQMEDNYKAWRKQQDF